MKVLIRVPSRLIKEVDKRIKQAEGCPFIWRQLLNVKNRILDLETNVQYCIEEE